MFIRLKTPGRLAVMPLVNDLFTVQSCMLAQTRQYERLKIMRYTYVFFLIKINLESLISRKY